MSDQTEDVSPDEEEATETEESEGGESAPEGSPGDTEKSD